MIDEMLSNQIEVTLLDCVVFGSSNYMSDVERNDTFP